MLPLMSTCRRRCRQTGRRGPRKDSSTRRGVTTWATLALISRRLPAMPAARLKPCRSTVGKDGCTWPIRGSGTHRSSDLPFQRRLLSGAETSLGQSANGWIAQLPDCPACGLHAVGGRVFTRCRRTCRRLLGHGRGQHPKYRRRRFLGRRCSRRCAMRRIPPVRRLCRRRR